MLLSNANPSTHIPMAPSSNSGSAHGNCNGNHCQASNGERHHQRQQQQKQNSTQESSSNLCRMLPDCGAIPLRKMRERLPDLLQSVNVKHVRQGYERHRRPGTSQSLTVVGVLAMVALMVLLVTLGQWKPAYAQVGGWRSEPIGDEYGSSLASVTLCSGALIFAATLYCASRPRRVLLVDFACYRPRARYLVSHEGFIRCSERAGAFSEESLAFQRRVVARSGLGPETYLPAAIVGMGDCNGRPSMRHARAEAAEVMFSMLDDLFERTAVHPRDVAVLVVNCSLFNPTPSLASMIVNHYKMRGAVRSFNLGGMGCSAGLIAIDLAKDLLQVHPNSYAVVVSMENLSLAWYFGDDRSMLVSNCIFRMGGAAILLSNVGRERRRAKYELVHTVRTHKGADDRAYNCVYQREDTEEEEACENGGDGRKQEEEEEKKRKKREGNQGVCLSRDLMSVAGDALKTNITTLGPLVLPLREQLLFFASLVRRRLVDGGAKPYIPDFKLAFEHFCIHAGGRAVLEEVERNLRLSPWHMEPSRMTLYRFGNTSSSSLWYELSYAEEKGRIKRGHRVWQIAFGAGFKCNSAVWRALRDVAPGAATTAWSDCIHKYPVNVGDGAVVVDHQASGRKMEA